MTQILSARSIAVYVTAIEMTRQEYNQIRGWELPADENGDDKGYLIEDPAGQKNTDDYEGFVQWLPKAEFERKFSVDDDACGEAEPDMKDADCAIGMNAVSSIPHRVRDDIFMLIEVLKVTRGASHDLRELAEGVMAELLGNAFPPVAEDAELNELAAEAQNDERIKVSIEQLRNGETVQTEFGEDGNLHSVEDQPSTPKDRVMQEQAELSDKITKLGDFIAKGKPEFLDSSHWHLLIDQIEVMKKYNNILIERLDLF